MVLRTIPFKPGIVRDDPNQTSEGWGVSSQFLRWVRGRAQWWGGWSAATVDTTVNPTGFANPCRGMYAWTDNDGSAYCAIGTRELTAAEELVVVVDNPAIFNGRSIYDITPESTNATFSSNPFTTSAGSSAITVSRDGRPTGLYVVIWDSSAVGGITPGGPAGTFGADPFTLTSGSPVIQVTHSAHGMLSHDEVTIGSSATIGGIVPSGNYIIHVESSSGYSIQHTSAAALDTVGGGALASFSYGRRYVITAGASTYTIQHPQAATSGATGGGATAKFRLLRSTTQTEGDDDIAWSFSQYDQDLIACPKYGVIYQWSRNRSQRATPVSNAPAQVYLTLVSAERYLMAFGCTSSSGTFDPMLIRWSDSDDRTVWAPASTNNAGSLRLGRGALVVAAKNTRGGILVLTDTAAYFVRYTGSPDSVYEAELLGEGCGCCGTNALVEQSGAAFWITPAGQFYQYAGGTPRPMQCPSQEWFRDLVGNFTSGGIRIFGMYDSAFPAIQWLFGSTNTYNEYYIRYDLLEGGSDPRAGWSDGQVQWEGWIDRGVFTNPLAVTRNGQVMLLEHGTSDNGAAVARAIEWGAINLSSEELGDGTRMMNIRRLIIDRDHTGGDITITLTGRRFPLSTARTKTLTVTTSTEKNDARMQAGQLGIALRTSGSADTLRLGNIRADLSPGPRMR